MEQSGIYCQCWDISKCKKLQWVLLIITLRTAVSDEIVIIRPVWKAAPSAGFYPIAAADTMLELRHCATQRCRDNIWTHMTSQQADFFWTVHSPEWRKWTGWRSKRWTLLKCSLAGWISQWVNVSKHCSSQQWKSNSQKSTNNSSCRTQGGSLRQRYMVFPLLRFCFSSLPHWLSTFSQCRADRRPD